MDTSLFVGMLVGISVTAIPAAGSITKKLKEIVNLEREVEDLKRGNLREATIALQIETTLDGIIQKQERELTELRAERERRLAPLVAANEARKAKRLEREAQAALIQQARHAEMHEAIIACGLGEAA